MKDISLEIDGRELKAQTGMTVLEVAQEAGIKIPTLCYHKALPPLGVCRLCTVEITSKGRSRLVTACTYPVEEGIVVKTDSPNVKRTRKILLELLLARCPNVDVIQELAREYGVEKPRFKKIKDERCILCGLCTQICRERMGVSAINFVGRGINRKVDTPFHVASDICQTCGACAFICPTGAIKLEDIAKNRPIPIASEFDKGLAPRSPIYVPYPQAVPNVPAIDRDTCIHLLTGECGICQEFCQAEAINFDQEDEVVDIDIGAVILTPGLDEFDASAVSNYGYGLFPNVITSIEFERILSASGPFQGDLLRPSDRRPPQKIAWIQCVGSRDIHTVQNSYCSSVCCTYAIKEAVVAKEHSSIPLETTIFYIDIRTHGKGFEQFYERAKDEHGVRFVRSQIHRIYQDEKGDLTLRFVDDNRIKEEEFDLVVLSVGLRPPEGMRELAENLGVELNQHGFCRVGEFSPVATSRAGIFTAGVFSGPKDIPETVVEASAAASEASLLLSPARHSLTVEKQYPQERDVSQEEPRIGVFVCHCGINIGGVVDVPRVKEYARSLPNVAFVDENLFTCSQDTQQIIREKIEEHNLNRVVVASCTPRTHEPLFQETLREAGLNKYLFEMANIRDQCSWVHMKEPEKATEKAKDLVKMAVAKARLIKPLKEMPLEVNHGVLVVGGGISGMVSALSLAEQGFEIHLVERASRLGGLANRIHHTVEGLDVQAYLKELIDKVSQDPLIHVYKEADIQDISGYVGNFTTRLLVRPEGEVREINHGVAIIASGGDVYRPDEYLYGKHPGVLTLLELEEEIAKGNPQIRSGQNVVFIQCVGSREQDRPYCSRLCCCETVKLALQLKEINPDMNIYVLYRDIRTYGFNEEYYQEARAKGVLFIPYDIPDKPEVEAITENGKDILRVSVDDPILGERLSIDADVLALATATVPSPGNEELARFLKVPLNADGFFLEAHVKLRPVDAPTDGVFLCGLAHSPKLIEESIAQAKAAASKAATTLVKDVIYGEGMIASIDRDSCSGCQICIAVCPYNAITFNEEDRIAEVQELLCKGCGNCTAACPSGACSVKNLADEHIFAEIEALA